MGHIIKKLHVSLHKIGVHSKQNVVGLLSITLKIYYTLIDYGMGLAVRWNHVVSIIF